MSVALAVAGLGLGALFLMAAKGGLPAQSGPDQADVKKLRPIKTTQTINGRIYDVWQWPRVDPYGHYYVVASHTQNKRIWMSFYFIPEQNLRIPQKTNVGDLGLTPNAASALLSILKTDWGLPA